MSHVGICVSDPERSTAFYRDGLGFSEARELAVEGEAAATLLRLSEVKLRAVYLERDGVCIELLHYADPGVVGSSQPREMNRLGLTHLSLVVDDLDAALARLEDCGATTLQETRIEDPGLRARAAFVTDPDGTLIELVETAAA